MIPEWVHRESATILMIENESLVARPGHLTRTALYLSAMRQFAEELRSANYDVDYRVGLADIGEELVAKPLAFRRSLHQPGNVHEGNARRHDLLGLAQPGELVETRMRLRRHISRIAAQKAPQHSRIFAVRHRREVQKHSEGDGRTCALFARTMQHFSSRRIA